MKDYVEMLNKLLTILGNVNLAEAKTWAEVKANAEALREEGHEAKEGRDEDPHKTQ